MGRVLSLQYPLLKTTTNMGGPQDTLGRVNDAINISNASNTRYSNAQSQQAFGDSSGAVEQNANYDINYITFVPMQVKSQGNLGNIKGFKELGKIFGELIGSAKNGFTPEGFKRGLTTVVTKSGDSLYLSLPAKPFGISFNHTYTPGQSVQLNANSFKNVWNLARDGLKSELTVQLRKFASNNKVLSTALNQIGVSTFTPQRAFYSGSTPIKLSFDWIMTPKNRLEAEVIRKIVTAFKVLSMPQKYGDVSANESVIYLRKNPAIWRIDYSNTLNSIFDKVADQLFDDIELSNSKAINKLQEFKNKLPTLRNLFVKNNSFELMVCDKVDINYGTGDFWTTFSDGFPNEIKLSLSFQQLFPLASAQDVFGDDPMSEIFGEGFLNGREVKGQPQYFGDIQNDV